MSASRPAPREFRLRRRPDIPGFEEVVLLAVGEFERATGLDASAEATIRSLGEVPVRAIAGFLRAIGHPIVDLVVAADGPKVVGTGMILWVPETAYVAGIATRPEVRGQGVATGVLARLEVEARRRHRGWLALDVESQNANAIRVYQRAGYQEVLEFSWYTRNGVPERSAPFLPGTHELARSERRAVMAELDASRPSAYRAAFPAHLRALSHNEYLLRGPRVLTRTWVHRPSGSGPCVLRAYFLPGSRLGALFPMVGGGADPPVEILSSLLEAASEWLRPLAPLRCLAATSEPPGSTGATLERAGFTRVVSSKAMLHQVFP